jgi:hypothetical protein
MPTDKLTPPLGHCSVAIRKRLHIVFCKKLGVFSKIFLFQYGFKIPKPFSFFLFFFFLAKKVHHGTHPLGTAAVAPQGLETLDAAVLYHACPPR